MTELAQIAGLSRSRLSHAIDSLEERGWVTRTSCSSDKRTLTAALTDAGRTLVDRAFTEHMANERRLLDGLSEQQSEQLERLLTVWLGRFE
jgi:DNA-binding MarR family transcriptional regulator